MSNENAKSSEELEDFEEYLPSAPEGCKTVLASEGRLYNAWTKEAFTGDGNGKPVFLDVNDPEIQLSASRFQGADPVIWKIVPGPPVVEQPQEQPEQVDVVIPEPPPGAVVFRKKKK